MEEITAKNLLEGKTCDKCLYSQNNNTCKHSGWTLPTSNTCRLWKEDELTELPVGTVWICEDDWNGVVPKGWKLIDKRLYDPRRYMCGENPVVLLRIE